ncbi:MAG: hypothetical protein ABSH20_21985 [Tepidisphaeraceae bacterium]|jgi:hypothetical protein
MTLPTGFGFRWSGGMPDLPRTEEVMVQRPLMRILAFLNISIDQVCSDPIARNKVACYYRLQKSIDRQMELTELEQQWSGAGSVFCGRR